RRPPRSPPFPSTTLFRSRLDVAAPSGRVSVVTEGFWGIPVRKGARYRLGLFARRSAGVAAPLTVSLEGAGGQVYARTELTGLSRSEEHTSELQSQSKLVC